MKLIHLHVSLALFFISLASQLVAAERPNIIYILADDMGYGDVQVLTSLPANQLPKSGLSSATPVLIHTIVVAPSPRELLSGFPAPIGGAIQHQGALGPYGNLKPTNDTEFNNTIDDVFSPRNNFYFPRQISSRRIITFLSQQPQVNPEAIGVTGHSTGGALATQVSIDPRIKAAVPSMGGAGGLYLEHPHLTGNVRNQGNFKGDDLEIVKATVDGYAYYKKMHAPVLAVSCTNDFNAPDWNFIQSLKLATVDKRFSCAANLSHKSLPEVA